MLSLQWLKTCKKKVATSKKRLLHLLRAIEGISSWRRQSINKIQAEVNQLQNRIDTEEDELQQEIDRLLVDIEEEGKDRPYQSLDWICRQYTQKNSEEVALMKNAMPNFKLKQQFYELTWRHAMEGATRKLRSI